MIIRLAPGGHGYQREDCSPSAFMSGLSMVSENRSFLVLCDTVGETGHSIKAEIEIVTKNEHDITTPHQYTFNIPYLMAMTEQEVIITQFCNG